MWFLFTITYMVHVCSESVSNSKCIYCLLYLIRIHSHLLCYMYNKAVQSLHYNQFLTRHNLITQPDYTTWLHNLTTKPDCTTWLHNLQSWHTCFFCSGEDVEGATLVPCDCSNRKRVVRVGIQGTELYDNCALIGWPRLWATILWTGHIV